MYVGTATVVKKAYALLGWHVLVHLSFKSTSVLHACTLVFSLLTAWVTWYIIWMASCWPDELKGCLTAGTAATTPDYFNRNSVTLQTFWPRFNLWQSVSLLFIAIIDSIQSQCCSGMRERNDISVYICIAQEKTTYNDRDINYGAELVQMQLLTVAQ